MTIIFLHRLLLLFINISRALTSKIMAYWDRFESVPSLCPLHGSELAVRNAFIREEHLRHTDTNREIYAMRKETIERVFAD